MKLLISLFIFYFKNSYIINEFLSIKKLEKIIVTLNGCSAYIGLEFVIYEYFIFIISLFAKFKHNIVYGRV